MGLHFSAAVVLTTALVGAGCGFSGSSDQDVRADAQQDEPADPPTTQATTTILVGPDAPPVLGQWSGEAFAITHTGDYSWESTPIALGAVPSGWSISHRIEGGEASLTNLTVVPAEADNQPAGSYTAVIKVSFTVVDFSGTPSFVLADARAIGE